MLLGVLNDLSCVYLCLYVNKWNDMSAKWPHSGAVGTDVSSINTINCSLYNVIRYFKLCNKFKLAFGKILINIIKFTFACYGLFEKKIIKIIPFIHVMKNMDQQHLSLI